MNLLERPEWYLLGPAIGLIVVGLFAVLDQRIGVMGGYSNFVERATGRIPALSWRAWFLIGVLLGALAWRLPAGESTVGPGFGWLTREFESGAVVAGVLLGSGILVGYGAKLAGGCTSGNGLGGCSAGSPASVSATATFIGTAIAVSFAIEALT
jgi:uncharacterized protein